MRRINAFLTSCIIVLFLIHLIWGGLLLAGMVKGGSTVFSALSWVMLGLADVHVVLSVRLTVDTVIAMKRSGVSYWKENRLFWIRRISGIALVLFMVLHVLIFRGDNSTGSFRLNLFDLPALITQILLVASLLVHLVSNIPPLRIAFGLGDKKNLKTDLMLVLSILLVIAALAFVAYFIRWQVI